MLLEYLPIFIFLVFAVIFASIMLGIGFTFGSSNPDPEKNSPYECGFEAFEDSRMKFDIRYYLVAILFIIFDLEIAFLFPFLALTLEYQNCLLGRIFLLQMIRLIVRSLQGVTDFQPSWL